MRTGLLFAAMLLFNAGCGGGADEGRVAVFEVTGKITNSGAPLADAAVTFSPKGDQPIATGKTDAKGVYKLTTYEYEDGAAAGDFTVIITKTVEKAPAATSMGHDESGGGLSAPAGDGHSGQGAKKTDTVSMVNAKYSSAGSPLEATVKDGENNFDFALEP